MNDQTTHSTEDIWTQFHDLRHPTTFLEPYSGRLLQFWIDFFTGFPPDRRHTMLDIGTGNLPIPKIMLGIRGHEFDIHAIDTADIRPEQVPATGNVHFYRRTAEDTGFPGAMFDGVTGCFALEYSELERSLPELHRVMKPRARGAFVLHHPDSVSVQSARAAMREDIPVILESGIFEATQEYVAEPSPERRRAVEEILARRLDRPELSRFWRVDAVVKTVNRYLHLPSMERFVKWRQSFLLDQRRREALLAGVVEDRGAFRALLEASGFRVSHFGPIEDVAGAAAVPPGAAPPAPGAAEVLGWGLLLTRAAAHG
ncbi:MAG: methyltransferase domain-containing protein [Xanthomonadales bacterium]|nr:methyltransferase domain-containing protein [Xanthomonadales bacterium]NIN58589.1 methyltransferase domain-containing protein [Xanthomonadales bacterium]NIN73878.1 methyltransferase domain-containing protein [Xanthomonadales bacterium]NIO12347.1 methyltransferase domain-containing protein [Xanthomonadales bacterium]NIP10982.1 methyltransferase domain-containing protein [Xanthomonadales bacterium]